MKDGTIDWDARDGTPPLSRRDAATNNGLPTRNATNWRGSFTLISCTNASAPSVSVLGFALKHNHQAKMLRTRQRLFAARRGNETLHDYDVIFGKYGLFNIDHLVEALVDGQF